MKTSELKKLLASYEAGKHLAWEDNADTNEAIRKLGPELVAEMIGLRNILSDAKLLVGDYPELQDRINEALAEHDVSEQQEFEVAVVAELVRRGRKATYEYPGYINIEDLGFGVDSPDDTWHGNHAELGSAWDSEIPASSRDVDAVASWIISCCDKAKGQPIAR